MLATLSGQLACVKELCYFGADKHLTGQGGYTLLHWAVDSGHCELVSWLLDNGADVNARDVNGWTPLLRICTTSFFRSRIAFSE